MNEISVVSESCLLIRVGEAIDIQLTDRIRRITQAIQQQLKPEVVEVIPSYTTILVQCHPTFSTPEHIKQRLQSILIGTSEATATPHHQAVIELPVYYSAGFVS